MKKTDPARPYIRAMLEKNRLRFFLAALLGIALQFPMLFVSWMLGEVIDMIEIGEAARLLRVLWPTAVFMAVLLAAELAYARLKAGLFRRAVSQYRALAFRDISNKSISAFSRENTGRYLAVLTSDVEKIQTDYLETALWLIPRPVGVLGALWMMLRRSPLLTLITVALSLLPIVTSLLFSPGLTRRERAVSDQNEGFVGTVKDLLSGFSVIKSFKAERETAKVFGAVNDAVEKARESRRWWASAMSAAGELSTVVMQLGIFFIGALLAIRGRITPGTVLIFVNLIGSFLSSIQNIPQEIAKLRAARGLFGKQGEVVSENASRSGEAIESVLEDGIALQNVSYGYEEGKPVLKDLSLKLKAGRSYALVGISGSGKSTLLNLLMGAGAGYEGRLTVDGKELRDISPDSLYDLMSLIDQSVFLFDDTVRRNITMFRDFPEEAVDSAVELSGLAPVLREKGGDYRCGEGGRGLSGGERQRISIARALLRGTPVLLLDEATSALDNETARAVTEAILDLQGYTRLVVTHRLDRGALSRFDSILALRDGRLCEQGTFSELMEKKGYFYSLYTVSAE